MVDTYEDPVNEVTKSFLEFDPTTELLQRIDTQSRNIQKAIKELADTYQYASLSVSTALQTAQRFQEIKSEEEPSVDRKAYFQSCHQAYIHEIEETLAGLSNTLTASIKQNRFKNYLQLVHFYFEIFLKDLQGKGG